MTSLISLVVTSHRPPVLSPYPLTFISTWRVQSSKQRKPGVRAPHKCSCLEISFESQGQETDSGSSGKELPSYITKACVNLKEFLENTILIFCFMCFVSVLANLLCLCYLWPWSSWLSWIYSIPKLFPNDFLLKIIKIFKIHFVLMGL